ncbi:MAG: hypothetical protein ACR2NN_12750 [Bryobacteraceae bacterium]
MPNPSNTRAWQIDALLASAKPAAPFSSDTGQVFATIPLNTEAQQVVPLSSRAFYNWLLNGFHGKHEIAPRPSALREVIQLLEAKAQFGESTTHRARPTIARRIASAPGKVMLDLYNDQGEAVEITSSGWRITQNIDGCFRSARSAHPLPHPVKPAHSTAAVFDDLRTLLGLSPEHFAPCLSWLIAALNPTGPYPILVLQGPASSGKSSIAQILRALIDPGPSPFCPPPACSRDLQSLASHNWIVALDGIDLLPAPLVRKLTRIATGATFAARDRASDPEPFHLHLSRPMLFTTTPFTTERAFSDRAITINLPAQSDPASYAEFEQLRPQVLGALCETISASLAGKPSKYETAAHWMTTADPIAEAVSQFMTAQATWTGTATELLIQLRALNPALSWPETPKGLTQLLYRTGLNNIDFQSLQDSHGTRSVSLQKIELAPKLSADALQPTPAPTPALTRGAGGRLLPPARATRFSGRLSSPFVKIKSSP